MRRNSIEVPRNFELILDFSAWPGRLGHQPPSATTRLTQLEKQ